MDRDFGLLLPSSLPTICTEPLAHINVPVTTSTWTMYRLGRSRD